MKTEIAATHPDLVRELSAAQATAVVVGTVIGSAIFVLPAEMMQSAGSPRLVSLAWVVGGVVSICGAMTYAELSAMRPNAGGDYLYLRDAYGPLVGFLRAWNDVTIGTPAAIAAVTTGLIRVLSEFTTSGLLAKTIAATPFTRGQAVAIFTIFFIAALNYVGVRRAAEFQLMFTSLKVLLVLAIVIASFFFTRGHFANFSSSLGVSRSVLAGFYAALVAALWAFDGWADLAQLAGEVREPQRNLPRALISGVFIVAGLYMLLYAGVQFAFPAGKVATLRFRSPS